MVATEVKANMHGGDIIARGLTGYIEGELAGNGQPNLAKFSFQNLGHLVVLPLAHMVYGIDPINKKVLWDDQANTYRFACGHTCRSMQPRYTEKQGQYLAFIYYYTKLHRVAPVVIEPRLSPAHWSDPLSL